MKKAMYHERKTCGGQYSVEHTDAGLPYLLCDKCGNKIEDWVKWSQEYSCYWEDKEKWLSKKNHLVCLLGLFLSLYRNYYGIDFVLSLNEGGLFRSAEANHIRKLYYGCGSDADLAADYIRWVFAKKVAERKRKITSLGFLTTAAMLNEFKQTKKRASLVGRSTPLPQSITKWVASNAPDLNLKDFGDLKTLLKHFAKGRVEDERVQVFVNKLQKSGIVDDRLEISRWSDQ